MKKNVLFICSLLINLFLLIAVVYVNIDLLVTDDDIPFPSTNLPYPNPEPFGEAASKPETAVAIARAVLNDWLLRRMGLDYFGDRMENFSELFRSRYDENFPAWVASAIDTDDTWIVTLNLYIPPDAVGQNSEIPHINVTIRKSDGKVIDVFTFSTSPTI